jgi:hypothetical protein
VLGPLDGWQPISVPPRAGWPPGTALWWRWGWWPQRAMVLISATTASGVGCHCARYSRRTCTHRHLGRGGGGGVERAQAGQHRYQTSFNQGCGQEIGISFLFLVVTGIRQEAALGARRQPTAMKSMSSCRAASA